MDKTFQPRRRTIVAAGLTVAGMAGIGVPAIAQPRTKIRIGYVDTLAVTGQLWTGVHRGHWAKEGLEFDPVKFNTGLDLFNAMIGGSLDMLSTGAVISNFPARGQGKAFLINNIEFATAQLWIREDQGVKTWADLKGKKISTTLGTTAHVFLDAALRANGIDPAKDVELVNQGMAVAVTSFISGAVPAVALWVPFNIQVRQRVPSAKMLVDASAYFPKSAIVGGWATRSDYYEKNRPVLAQVVRGWAASNDDLIRDSATILPVIQAKNYAQVPLEELQEQFKASRYYTSAEWRKLYQDGTAVGWLQQVTDFYTRFGGIQNPVPASTYFDTALLLDNVKA
jgi:NitT/TauT family transport system substrate-binding protein